MLKCYCYVTKSTGEFSCVVTEVIGAVERTVEAFGPFDCVKEMLETVLNKYPAARVVDGRR